MRKKTFVFLVLIALFAVSPPQAMGALSKEDEREVALGKKVCEQVEKKWERVTDPVPVARLAAILQKILPEARKPFPYEVRLIREKQPNAFSLPGGFIYFTTGMLDFAKSDAELASVMAHEMIHADNSHGMIQSARNERLSLLALAVAVASRGEAAAMIMANIAQVAILNAYGRDLEKEADLGALRILHATGFPVAASVTVMERLAEEQLKHPYVNPGVFMDHPEIPERIGYMVKFIRNSGWALHRKEPLHLLRISIESQEDRFVMTVDGKAIWRGPVGEKVRVLMEGVKRGLDQSLQMELMSNEIEVRPDGKSRVLRVGQKAVVRESDLPAGMDSLDVLSENLKKALIEAQRVHPMGHYLL
ncbi:MAG TPA: M48 family metalloprotease [Synergistales bacterium]|nr:M48 family metalloprotease [Synergistales bacterium]